MHTCGRWPSIREWADWWRTHRSWANSTNNTRIGHHTSEEVRWTRRAQPSNCARNKAERSGALHQHRHGWYGRASKWKRKCANVICRSQREDNVTYSIAFTLCPAMNGKRILFGVMSGKKETRLHLGAYKHLAGEKRPELILVHTSNLAAKKRQVHQCLIFTVGGSCIPVCKPFCMKNSCHRAWLCAACSQQQQGQAVHWRRWQRETEFLRQDTRQCGG